MKLGYFSTGAAQIEMFENRVLWKIFGPKCDIATGYRELQNEEIYNWYCSPHIMGCKNTGSHSGTA
jgi:hypothetical protein